MAGIDKIKDLLALPFALHMAYDKAAEDGSVDVGDIGHLISPITKIANFANALKDGVVLKQFKDLDDAERQALNEWAKKEYDIADDMLEMKIEAAFDVVFSVGKLIGALQGPQPVVG